MKNIEIAIITFTHTEKAAVDDFFKELTDDSHTTRWRIDSEGSVDEVGIVADINGRRVKVVHQALLAQGNVIAGARLARLFHRKVPPAWVIFYGCAGAAETTAKLGEAFLVSHVSYASLGTVERENAPTGERVTLKNKWVCELHPDVREVMPLETLGLLTGTEAAVPDLLSATGLTAAHVVATDKVTRVNPEVECPPPNRSDGTHGKAEWTYGATLRYLQDHVVSANTPMIVEMESYGIAAIAHAFDLDRRVVIIRVVTDHLVDHTASEKRQGELLKQGNVLVGSVIHAILQ